MENLESYVEAIDTANDFGMRLYKEAKRRVMDRADEVCVLAMVLFGYGISRTKTIMVPVRL
jgi:hypothetical protein